MSKSVSGRIKKQVTENNQRKPNGAPHFIVQARAGTGKTTTLVEGLKRVKGLPTTIDPSPQQQAVWEQMELSKDARFICFVAFNKSIATELQRRVPQGCDAMTMHSMGLKAVTKAFGRVNVDSYRVQDIISEILERDIRELRKENIVLVSSTEKLVSLCKQNLLEGTQEELADLASYYDVDTNDSREKIFDLVPKVIERCKDVKRDGKIDFNDMIWLPIVLNLPVFQYDFLLVDESQDLNRCQQALALKAGKRLGLVGDDMQAIYGFAGADSESMNRMAEILGDSPVGCVTLPLTVTRRCGKVIVQEAKQYVPDFEAHESNGEGSVGNARFEIEGLSSDTEHSYHGYVQDGDMLLCRVNAPLVSQCFRFIRAGRKATIQGRDIGQGLISTVKKMKTDHIDKLIEKLHDWYEAEVRKENAKRNPSDARLIALQDRRDCLLCFCEDSLSVASVISKIETIFADGETQGIKLSSIHKAKGLESDRVFFLLPKGGECPHPMAKQPWAKAQEANLRYVAITRAIKELVYVT